MFICFLWVASTINLPTYEVRIFPVRLEFKKFKTKHIAPRCTLIPIPLQKISAFGKLQGAVILQQNQQNMIIVCKVFRFSWFIMNVNTKNEQFPAQTVPSRTPSASLTATQGRLPRLQTPWSKHTQGCESPAARRSATGRCAKPLQGSNPFGSVLRNLMKNHGILIKPTL